MRAGRRRARARRAAGGASNATRAAWALGWARGVYRSFNGCIGIPSARGPLDFQSVAIGSDVIRTSTMLAAVLLLALPQLVASNDHDALASALRADFEARGKEQCGHLPWWRPAGTSRTTTSTSSHGGGHLDPKGTGERDGDGRARVIYQLPPTGFGDQLAGLTTAAAAAVLTNRSLSLSVPPTWGLVFEFNAAATATTTASSAGSDAVVQAEGGAQVKAAAAEVELDCQDSPARRRGKNRGKRGGASPSSTGSEPTVPLCSPPLQVAKQEEGPLVLYIRTFVVARALLLRTRPTPPLLTPTPPHHPTPTTPTTRVRYRAAGPTLLNPYRAYCSLPSL